MPNTHVRAAAEGMSDCPRNSHWSAFFRKLPMPWHARAGSELAVSNTVSESFMNQHVNRRNVFASSVAIAAVLPFDSGHASPLVERAKEKVDRLARELSFAMDDWMDDLGGDVDQWVAEIWPSKSRELAIGFRHNLGGWTPDAIVSPVLQKLETKFHAEFEKYEAMVPELDAAERRYFDMRPERPVEQAMSDELLAILNDTRVVDLKNESHPYNVKHAEQFKEFTERRAAYDAECAKLRKRTGFGKVEDAYRRQTSRVCDAADRALLYPARSVADLAVKARIHKRWTFIPEEASFNALLADMARIAKIKNV